MLVRRGWALACSHLCCGVFNIYCSLNMFGNSMDERSRDWSCCTRGSRLQPYRGAIAQQMAQRHKGQPQCRSRTIERRIRAWNFPPGRHFVNVEQQNKLMGRIIILYYKHLPQDEEMLQHLQRHGFPINSPFTVPKLRKQAGVRRRKLVSDQAA